MENLSQLNALVINYGATLSTFFCGSIRVHWAVYLSEILHMSCLIGGPWLQALLPIVCRAKSKT